MTRLYTGYNCPLYCSVFTHAICCCHSAIQLAARMSSLSQYITQLNLTISCARSAVLSMLSMVSHMPWDISRCFHHLLEARSPGDTIQTLAKLPAAYTCGILTSLKGWPPVSEGGYKFCYTCTSQPKAFMANTHYGTVFYLIVKNGKMC
jgi:hypothetical protein